MSDTFLIDRGEWICIHDIEFGIGGKETAGVVPAHSKRGLRQVICAEAEEIGVARDLIGHERGARDFNHCPD